MVADSELCLTVYPFPINPQDILNIVGEIEPDFEELVHMSSLTTLRIHYSISFTVKGSCTFLGF